MNRYLVDVEASPESLSFAGEILKWVEAEKLLIESVDPDVLGGVAIYLTSSMDREAWFCILDSGERSIVLSDSNRVTGFAFNDKALQKAKEFLRGE